jgi:Tfp pilus assembly protein PilN
MSTTLAVRPQTATTLPHVNLLPDEILEEARFRNVRAGLLLVVAVVIVAVGFLYWQASGQDNDAQAQLTQAQAAQTGLQAQIAKYASVPKKEAQVQLAQTQLTTAMGQEVRYSYLLNDIVLTIPNDVWLTQLTVNQKVTTPVTGPAATTTSSSGTGGAVWTAPGIGTISVQGSALSYDDVAAWLDALAKSPNYSGVYLNTAAVAPPVNATKVFNFTSQANITTHAYSNRYTSKAGQ